MNQDRIELIEKISYEIIDESIKDLLMNFKFLDLALSSISFSSIDSDQISQIGTDGKIIYFNSNYLIEKFKEVKTETTINNTRMIMHSLLHCLFYHPSVMINEDTIVESLWDLACDIATEYMIDDFNNPIFGSKKTSKEAEKINVYIKIKNHLIKKFNNDNFIVKNLYKYLLDCSYEQVELYKKLFTIDEHYNWNYFKNEDEEQINEDKEKWDKVVEYTKTGIDILEKIKGTKPSELHNQLKVLTSTKYDYKKFLLRFMEYKEEIGVDLDTFDPIYYTLGLSLYKNVPLIEYNEVKEIKRIEDLVLIIDTSASTYGRLVKKFISETWSIISQLFDDSLDYKVRLHIIQSDAAVQNYQLIESYEQYKEYMDNFELFGGGGTDFRPALEMVNVMKEEKKFNDLKGVLYFTDGYGEYPKQALDFDTVFVFCIDDEYISDEIVVPSWAMKIVLSKEDILED